MWRALYIENRFFIVLTILVLCFVLSYTFPMLYGVSILLAITFLVVVLFDLFLLFSTKDGIGASRKCPPKFSNGDDNPITIDIENQYSFSVSCKVIDELPPVFQIRDKHWVTRIQPHHNEAIQYVMRPLKRGDYHFGKVNIFARTVLHFVSRRYQFDDEQVVRVYPSFLHLKKYEMIAFSENLRNHGQRKLRKLGNTTEFEQIKQYVPGDDPRHINWKATARTSQIMVNQYTDERSQQIICIVDKGRAMKMPFEGLSLLDYSINATVALADIILKSGDKAGLITFSNKLSSYLPASKRKVQLQNIFEVLYNQRTFYKESDFDLLNSFVSQRMNQRSLLILFSNFESMTSFQRQLPYFRSLSKKHMVLVVFFKNTELDEMTEARAQNIEQIYTHTMASQFKQDKFRVVEELRRYGILSVLTRPNDLTIDLINKYIEIKKRQLL